MRTDTHPGGARLNNPVIRLARAVGLAEAGDPEAAIDQAEELLHDEGSGLSITARLGVYKMLIEWHGQAGRPDQCRRLASAALDEAREELPDDDEIVLVLRNSEVYWMCVCGLEDLAQPRFESLLRDVERVLGPTHPLSWAVRNNAAMPLKIRGDHAGAARIYRGILADMEAVLDESDVLALTARDNYAEALAASGDYDAAIDHYQRILDILSRSFPAGDWRSLRVRDEIARVNWAKGEVQCAEQLWTVLLDDCREYLGECDEMTAGLRMRLMGVRLESGDLAAALEAGEELSRHLPPSWGEVDVRAIDEILAEARANLRGSK